MRSTKSTDAGRAGQGRAETRVLARAQQALGLRVLGKRHDLLHLA